MTDKIKRLYIFTGKGGVGKTTLSFSFAKYLKEQGKKLSMYTLSPALSQILKLQLMKGKKMASN